MVSDARRSASVGGPGRRPPCKYRISNTMSELWQAPMAARRRRTRAGRCGRVTALWGTARALPTAESAGPSRPCDTVVRADRGRGGASATDSWRRGPLEPCSRRHQVRDTWDQSVRHLIHRGESEETAGEGPDGGATRRNDAPAPRQGRDRHILNAPEWPRRRGAALNMAAAANPAKQAITVVGVGGGSARSHHGDL